MENSSGDNQQGAYLCAARGCTLAARLRSDLRKGTLYEYFCSQEHSDAYWSRKLEKASKHPRPLIGFNITKTDIQKAIPLRKDIEKTIRDGLPDDLRDSPVAFYSVKLAETEARLGTPVAVKKGAIYLFDMRSDGGAGGARAFLVKPAEYLSKALGPRKQRKKEESAAAAPTKGRPRSAKAEKQFYVIPLSLGYDARVLEREDHQRSADIFRKLFKVLVDVAKSAEKDLGYDFMGPGFKYLKPDALVEADPEFRFLGQNIDYGARLLIRIRSFYSESGFTSVDNLVNVVLHEITHSIVKHEQKEVIRNGKVVSVAVSHGKAFYQTLDVLFKHAVKTGHIPSIHAKRFNGSVRAWDMSSRGASTAGKTLSQFLSGAKSDKTADQDREKASPEESSLSEGDDSSSSPPPSKIPEEEEQKELERLLASFYIASGFRKEPIPRAIQTIPMHSAFVLKEALSNPQATVYDLIALRKTLGAGGYALWYKENVGSLQGDTQTSIELTSFEKWFADAAVKIARWKAAAAGGADLPTPNLPSGWLADVPGLDPRADNESMLGVPDLQVLVKRFAQDHDFDKHRFSQFLVQKLGLDPRDPNSVDRVRETVAYVASISE
jgi:hypothetical protein